MVYGIGFIYSMQDTISIFVLLILGWNTTVSVRFTYLVCFFLYAFKLHWVVSVILPTAALTRHVLSPRENKQTAKAKPQNTLANLWSLCP